MHFFRNIVGEVGPIGVLICLDNKFQHFGSGFYTSTDCCNTTDSHAPIIVGYGTDKKHGDYWIMKNSYGSARKAFLSICFHVLLLNSQELLGERMVTSSSREARTFATWVSMLS